MNKCPSQDPGSEIFPLSHVGRSGNDGRMTSTLQLTLGESLRLMRERAGFSQAQLAGYLELGRTSVIRYEADRAVPRWRDVELWAQVCDHDPQIVRHLWVAARESGCIYDQRSLFDFVSRTDDGRFN